MAQIDFILFDAKIIELNVVQKNVSLENKISLIMTIDSNKDLNSFFLI